MRRTFYGATAFFLVLGVLWWRGTLPNWIQRQITLGYIREIQPHLPFEIESLTVHQSWRTLFTGLWSGKISGIEAVLKWGPWRLRLDGPVALARLHEKSEILVDFSPETTIEPANEHLSVGDRSDPIHFDFQMSVSSTFSHLSFLSFAAGATHWKWSMMGIDAERPRVKAHWDGTHAQVEVSSAFIKFEQNQKTAQITGFQTHASSPLILSPLTIGPEVEFDWKAKGAEALLGDLYLDLPLSLFPGKGKLTVESKPTVRLKGIALTIGEHPNPFSLSSEFTNTDDKSVALLSWNIPHLPLQNFLTGLITATTQGGGPLSGLAALGDFDWGPALVKWNGSAEVSLPTVTTPKHPVLSAQTDLKITELRFKPKRAPLSLDGVSLELKASTEKGAHLMLSVEHLRFKKFHGQLGPTSILVKPQRRFPFPKYSLTFQDGHDLPLVITGIPLRIGGPTGTLTLPIDGKSEFNFDIDTSLLIPPLSTAAIGEPLCLPVEHLPPAQTRVDFPQIKITAESIDPTGKISADLFGGKLEIDEIGFFDLFSTIPETDFNFRLTGIKLSELGAWLNFGEMDGIANILFQDATFQSWLPTHYDFNLDLQPLRKKKIVFSPEAMKNVIRIFARGNIDQLPGFANFLGFGLPRRMLGGYDIEYGGISLFSADGLILVETHDPPEIVKREGKHFILYGSTTVGPKLFGFQATLSKFMMPFETKDYPYVVDATAISNYIAGLYHRLGEMKKETQRDAPPSEDPECRE